MHSQMKRARLTLEHEEVAEHDADRRAGAVRGEGREAGRLEERRTRRRDGEIN